MKRNTLMIAALFVAGTVMSQDLTSKKGEMYLPEAGDYAIGIDANPLLNYLGNFIGGAGADDMGAPTFTAHGNETMNNGIAIYGKQFVDANTAYRGMVRIGFNSTNDRTLVGDLSDGAAADAMVEDADKTSSFNLVLGGGIEKRRGNTRLQGVYGGQAMIGLGTSKQTMEYGNNLTANNPGQRTTESKDGSTFMFGVGGFVGAEYFFAPKMSVAGEYTLGLSLESTGDSESTTERFEDNAVVSETSMEAGESAFGFDTGVLGGASLRLLFHF